MADARSDPTSRCSPISPTAGASLLITSDGGMPCVAHWGAPLGDADVRLLGGLERPVPGGGLDIDPPLGLVAESPVGWFGTPGLEGHRPDGTDFAPQFTLVLERRRRETAASFVLADDGRGSVDDDLGRVAPEWVSLFSPDPSPTRATGLLARWSATQPARAGAGARAVDGRRAVDERVRPDAHTVDGQLPDHREPSRQDLARATRRGVCRHRRRSPSTAARCGDATSGGAATSRSSATRSRKDGVHCRSVSC